MLFLNSALQGRIFDLYTPVRLAIRVPKKDWVELSVKIKTNFKQQDKRSKGAVKTVKQCYFLSVFIYFCL